MFAPKKYSYKKLPPRSATATRYESTECTDGIERYRGYRMYRKV